MGSELSLLEVWNGRRREKPKHLWRGQTKQSPDASTGHVFLHPLPNSLAMSGLSSCTVFWRVSISSDEPTERRKDTARDGKLPGTPLDGSTPRLQGSLEKNRHQKSQWKDGKGISKIHEPGQDKGVTAHRANRRASQRDGLHPESWERSAWNTAAYSTACRRRQSVRHGVQP